MRLYLHRYLTQVCQHIEKSRTGVWDLLAKTEEELATVCTFTHSLQNSYWVLGPPYPQGSCCFLQGDHSPWIASLGYFVCMVKWHSPFCLLRILQTAYNVVSNPRRIKKKKKVMQSRNSISLITEYSSSNYSCLFIPVFCIGLSVNLFGEISFFFHMYNEEFCWAFFS